MHLAFDVNELDADCRVLLGGESSKEFKTIDLVGKFRSPNSARRVRSRRVFWTPKTALGAICCL